MIRSHALVASILVTLFLVANASAQTTQPVKPRLGVRLAPATPDPGAMIMETMVGFAAESAGLRSGDRVIRIGGTSIDDVSKFGPAIATVRDGESVDFVIVRDGREQTLPVMMRPPRPDAPGAKEPTMPQLRDELLQMRQRDQAARMKLSEEKLPPDEEQKQLHDMIQADTDNRAQLKEIIAQSGYPTVTQVSQEAAGGAFLIVQHADRDVAWQKEMLPVLSDLATKGEASRSSVAYLTDRILRAEQKPQLYATQYYQEDVDGKVQYVPPVVENPANLNKRRMSMGLGPWEEYEKQMAQMQGREVFKSVRGPDGK